ncbi:hypothetical protein [Streptomyces sp. H27-D2]|uniref:hypothetical protein n=1 Tax=Streptomyces sp. H27-D2 TaxID=3046304 RepID=UPI002DBC1B8B|nr:hypothetical protein [Streptomyces sp. H27-D2]MEC4020232.1 hypothetical protein [Streptomyces sp. H27-D2]
MSDPENAGFAEAFSRRTRMPLRALVPGRRVWAAAAGVPLMAGLTAGAVVLVSVGVANLHFGGGSGAETVASKGAADRPTKSSQSRQGGKASTPTPSADKKAEPDKSDPGGGPGTAPHGSVRGAEGAPEPSKPAPTRKPAPAAGRGGGVVQSAATYDSVAGPSCPTPSRGGYYEQNRFNDGGHGWYNLTGGGYSDSGCTGVFASVPVSGDRNKDGNSRVMWWWEPGPGSRSCAISVYVPRGPSDRDVAGRPTTYDVLTDPFDPTTKVGGFTVDQIAHRASWVGVGTFAVKGGKIGVKLLDRGDDASSGMPDAHHAAGQMKVNCHA